VRLIALAKLKIYRRIIKASLGMRLAPYLLNIMDLIHYKMLLNKKMELAKIALSVNLDVG
jgi:hypothetical protein